MLYFRLKHLFICFLFYKNIKKNRINKFNIKSLKTPYYLKLANLLEYLYLTLKIPPIEII